MLNLIVISVFKWYMVVFSSWYLAKKNRVYLKCVFVNFIYLVPLCAIMELIYFVLTGYLWSTSSMDSYKYSNRYYWEALQLFGYCERR